MLFFQTSRRNDSVRNGDYWIDLNFSGDCDGTIGRNLTKLQEDIAHYIVKSLLLINDNAFKINSYECEDLFRLNITTKREVYENAEELLYQNLRDKKFYFKIFNRKFTFSGFTSQKLAIFKIKPLVIRSLRIFVLVAYGASMLAIGFILLSCLLYYGHYLVKRNKFKKNIKLELFNAFDEDQRASASGTNVKFESLSINYPDKIREDHSVKQESLVTLDYEIFSNSPDCHPYKLREKSQSVQGFQNFQDSPISLSTRNSVASERFEDLENIGFVHYKNVPYLFNKFYGGGSSDEASTEECLDGTPEKHLTSSESVGVTRVEYVSTKEPSFKFETDF